MKQTYHTDIAIQYKLGILSPEMIKKIPSSTLHNWKKKDFSTLIGAEYSAESDDNIQMIKDFMAKKSLLRAAKSIYIIYRTYSDIFKLLKGRKSILRKSKKSIVRTIDYVKDTLGLPRALRAFGITYQQYYSWKRSVFCQQSPTSLCLKRFTNQLTSKEVKTIKEYLKSPQYLQWSLSSVYYQMLRQKAAFMGKTTFYKYANLLYLSRSKPEKKKYPVGIRASAPSRILHMDVTIFRPLDNSRVYIYILMDNYSRYILNWKASLDYSPKITFENIQEAYQVYNLHKTSPYVELITDDGSENKGAVNEFVDNPGVNIRKLIAQKDIVFSNSMVEAVNKRLKYDFLFTTKMKDYEQTLRYLTYAVETYNTKPHSAHYGLTPKEVFNGAVPCKTTYSLAIRYAALKRSKFNATMECQECPNV